MNEDYVSKASIVAISLWVLTVMELVATWAILTGAQGLRPLGPALAATCCSTAAVATVAHIRAYMVRLASLVRIGAGLQGGEGLKAVR